MSGSSENSENSENSGNPADPLTRAARLKRSGQPEAAIALLREARRHHPGDARLSRRLAGLLWQTGARAGWLDLVTPLMLQEDPPEDLSPARFIRTAMKYGRMRDIAALVARRGGAALAGLDDPARLRACAACLCEGVAAAIPPPALGAETLAELKRLAAALLEAGRDEAVLALRMALARDAGPEAAGAMDGLLSTAFLKAAQEAGAAGDAALARSRQEAAQRLAPREGDQAARALMAEARMLHQDGAFGRAAAVLARIPEETPSPEIRRRIEALRQINARLSGQGADGAVCYLDNSVAHYPLEGATVCMVLFLNGRLIQEPQTVTRVRGILARAGLALLVVTDQRRFGAMLGFGPHEGDFPAAAAALEDLVAGLGYGRTLCMGSSVSASSAIRYGTAMGAIGALCFSAFFETPDPGKIRARGIRMRVERLRRALSAPLPTVADFLAPRPDFIVHYHYCENAQTAQTELPRLALLPQISCFPHEGGEHGVAELIHSGDPARIAYLPFLRACGVAGKRAE